MFAAVTAENGQLVTELHSVRRTMKEEEEESSQSKVSF